MNQEHSPEHAPEPRPEPALLPAILEVEPDRAHWDQGAAPQPLGRAIFD